jgi:hypothetical protein
MPNREIKAKSTKLSNYSAFCKEKVALAKSKMHEAKQEKKEKMMEKKSTKDAAREAWLDRKMGGHKMFGAMTVEQNFGFHSGLINSAKLPNENDFRRIQSLNLKSVRKNKEVQRYLSTVEEGHDEADEMWESLSNEGKLMHILLYWDSADNYDFDW